MYKQIILCFCQVLFMSIAYSQEKQEIIDIFEMSLAELMQLQVTTAGKTEQKITDIPASIIVVSRSDIETYGYHSISEILENVLGFYKHDDYRNEGFGVRGFFSNVYNRSFVLLVNGLEQRSLADNSNSFLYTNLQVEAIERIEIIRGPMSVMYGNNAFFGAINIITHTETESETESRSNITSSYGSDNTYRMNVQTTFRTDDTHTSIATGYAHTDGRDIPFEPILDRVWDYSGTVIPNATTKNFFNKDSKYLNVSSKVKHFYFNLSYDETARNLIHNLPPILDTLKNRSTDRFVRANAGYRAELSNRWTIDLQVNYLYSNLEQQYDMSMIKPLRMEYGQLFVNATYTSAEASFFYSPTEQLNITFGAITSSTSARRALDVPPIATNASDITAKPIHSNAVFAQVNYDLTSKLVLVAGGRFEKQNRSYLQSVNYNGGKRNTSNYSFYVSTPIILPRLALIYKINEQNTFKAMYGQAVSRASFTEDLIILGNTHGTLMPQQITTSELNYTRLFSDVVTLNASVFYNVLDQLISRTNIVDPETKLPVIFFNNSGKYQTLGGELQLQTKPLENLLLDVSLSYQKTKNETYAVNAGYSPNLLGYLKASYRIINNLSVSLLGNYVSEMESYWTNTPTEGRAHEKTPSYFKLGANIRYNEIGESRFYVNLHFDNITGTNIFYAPTQVNEGYLPNGTYDTGMHIIANLGIKF